MKKLLVLLLCAQGFWKSSTAQAPAAYEVYPVSIFPNN
jgi:hypothetical protein